MYVNKKVLSVAILGALVTGNAFAADLSAPGGAIPAYFAKEIVIGTNGTQLTTSASPATSLTWGIGYNFSQNEVRYARLECSNTIKFGAGTAVALSDAAAGNVGSINGLNTNTLTFSITSVGGPANNVIAADTLLVTGDHTITSTSTPVSCSVALYDQPSQAQAGGPVGLITNTFFSGPYLAFAPSYELVVDPTVHTADVEADPSFSDFIPNGNTGTNWADLGGYSLDYQVRDPDGAGTQTATFGVTGVPVTLATLLAPTTTITATGDFALAANANGSFTGAALNRAYLGAVGYATALNATTATFAAGNAGFTGEYVYVERRAGALIAEADYSVNLKAVAAAPTVYAVTDITGVKLGSIVRNGTQLQAPLAQVPGGWISRLALTNTGSVDRSYEIAVQGETGNTIGTANLTGTIPANSTKVVDLTTVLTSFTASPRATLNVTVAGPNNQIQGLYQIVNPDKGSISNHVLVRPGSN